MVDRCRTLPLVIFDIADSAPCIVLRIVCVCVEAALAVGITTVNLHNCEA